MRKRLLHSALALVLVIDCISAIACFAVSNSAKPTMYGWANDLWVHPNHEWMKATGPVHTILLEIAELSSEDWTERSRYPLMEFEYDRTGRIIKKTGRRDDSVVLPAVVYSYDDQSKLAKELQYNASGHVGIEVNYIYDTKGRPLERIAYDIDAGRSVLKNDLYDHDAKRNYVEVTEYRGESLRAKTGYLRDKSGRVIEQHQLSTLVQGTASVGYAGKIIFTYDDKGNVIQESTYGADSELLSRTTIAYEYDSYGNWVKRDATTEYVGDKSKGVIKDTRYRIINYYR